jgi:hypothetical protein
MPRKNTSKMVPVEPKKKGPTESDQSAAAYPQAGIVCERAGIEGWADHHA